MLALYRSGRQAEALEAFDEGRRKLAEELGLEPGNRLRRLQAGILAQEPELDFTDARRPRASAATQPHRRWWPAAVAGVAVAAALALGAVLVAGDEEQGGPAGRGGSLVRLDPRTGQVEQSVIGGNRARGDLGGRWSRLGGRPRRPDGLSRGPRIAGRHHFCDRSNAHRRGRGRGRRLGRQRRTGYGDAVGRPGGDGHREGRPDHPHGPRPRPPTARPRSRDRVDRRPRCRRARCGLGDRTGLRRGPDRSADQPDRRDDPRPPGPRRRRGRRGRMGAGPRRHDRPHRPGHQPNRGTRPDRGVRRRFACGRRRRRLGQRPGRRCGLAHRPGPSPRHAHDRRRRGCRRSLLRSGIAVGGQPASRHGRASRSRRQPRDARGQARGRAARGVCRRGGCLGRGCGRPGARLRRHRRRRARARLVRADLLPRRGTPAASDRHRPAAAGRRAPLGSADGAGRRIRVEGAGLSGRRSADRYPVVRRLRGANRPIRSCQVRRQRTRLRAPTRA